MTKNDCIRNGAASSHMGIKTQLLLLCYEKKRVSFLARIAHMEATFASALSCRKEAEGKLANVLCCTYFLIIFAPFPKTNAVH